jgi:hypothetical protein
LRRQRLDARHRSGLVDQIDGAVGQPVVAKMPRCQLRGGFEGSVRVADLVVFFARLLSPARIFTVSEIDGSSMAIFCSRLASARSFLSV